MQSIGIIGGGVGGLVTAIDLRRAGRGATIFERHAAIGGKLGRFERDGFRFDVGPTVLTMPFLLRELFESCDRSLDDYLTLRRVEPTCRYHWSDGTRFDAHSDRDRLDSELERLFPDDRESFFVFLDEMAELYEATKEIFLFNPFGGLVELFKPRSLSLLRLLPRLGIATTVNASLRRRFRSPKLVQLLGRFATYNGSSPYRASATLNIIPHVELGLGAWYPDGGMGSIASALERLALELGVDLRTGAAVERLERSGDGVGAVIAGGERHRVDAVVSNVDVLWTYRHLLEPIGIGTPRTVSEAERSCSGFLMLASVRGEHPELAHHNIFFSDDYPEEFCDIFEMKRLPRGMTIYISIASRSDRTLAPEGCEGWYILVNAPSSGMEHHDREAQRLYAESVWSRLRAFGIEPEIIAQSRLTPLDIERRDNSVGGAIYGASSNSPVSAFLRPRNRAPRPRNFYFCGGSAHPGGGVPLALLSGRITARLIRHDLAAQR